MRALVPLALLLAVCLSAAVSPTTSLESVGDSCGNRVSCGTGLICFANSCVQNPTASRRLEGLGNKCGASDCCGSNLYCSVGDQVCTPGFGQTVIKCGGDGATEAAPVDTFQEDPGTPDTPPTPDDDDGDSPDVDTPDVPDVDVDTPDVPTVPVPDVSVPNPDLPNSPDVPDAPEPDTPDVPNPDAPDTPDVPDTNTPDIPDTPDVPSVPVPGTPSSPDPPSVPAPDTPNPPATPDVPDIIDTPDNNNNTPDTPDKPNTPDVPETGNSDSDGEADKPPVVIPIGQSPRTNLGNDAVCGNADTCASGFSCINNKCVGFSAGALVGVGNTCDANNCCPNGLVCNTQAMKCAPNVALVDVTECSSGFVGGTGTGVVYQRANNEGATPKTNLPLNTACANQDTCAAGLACTVNVCQTASSSQVNGIGNVCSATNCCPNRLACNQATQRCTPAIVQLASTPCTSGFVGGPGTGVEYQTPTPLDVNDSGMYNAASGLTVHVAILSALALMAMLIVRW